MQSLFAHAQKTAAFAHAAGATSASQAVTLSSAFRISGGLHVFFVFNEETKASYFMSTAPLLLRSPRDVMSKFLGSFLEP